MARREDSGDERPVRSWVLWASKDQGGVLRYIGDRWYAKLNADQFGDRLVAVLVTEWLGPPSDPCVTHYGWENSERGFYPEMIQVRATESKPWAYLCMCFTYGMDVEVAAGNGSMTPLVVKEVSK